MFGYDDMIEGVLSIYVSTAIDAGYITMAQHDDVMIRLKQRAMKELRTEIQEHLDGHAKDGTECEELPHIIEMFNVTRESVNGRLIVGEPTEAMKKHVTEQQ
jgi:hypothetical protein